MVSTKAKELPVKTTTTTATIDQDQAASISNKFTMDKPEFDENTYWGRFEAFRATANPFNAFNTQSQIKEMQALLAQQKERENRSLQETGFKEVSMSAEAVREVRRAQSIVATAVHPDTGEFIPWALRFSSFIPMNIPIAFGFLFTAPTPFNTIFFQWLNQTYNASLNYANRNASSNYAMQDIAKSYTIATTSAIVVGLGIRKAMGNQLKAATGSRLVCLNAISSFFAIAGAGFLNAYFMRQTEIKTGIDVLDCETGEPLGKSQKCAKVAVMQTAISRIFLVTTMFVPPVILVAMERAKMTPTAKPAKISLELSLLFLQLYFAIPVGLAYFPRMGVIKATDLEPEFQQIMRKDGNKELMTEFMFNKGL